MSISEQVKKLMELADDMEKYVGIRPKPHILRESADAIESLSEKMQAANTENGCGWIACKDRLPEVGQIVIVCQSYREIHGNPGTSTSIGQYLGSYDNLPHWRFISYMADIYEKLTDAYMVDNYQIIGDNEYVISWKPLPEHYRP